MRINLMQTGVTARQPAARPMGATDAVAGRTKARSATRGRAAWTLVAALLVTGALATNALVREDSSVSKVPAHAWPGELTGGERAAVGAALGSPDARTRRLALDVAAGKAGSPALADASLLHHHGINTAAVAPRKGAGSPERFHHR